MFVEYVMLAGVNDRYEQALQLARLLSPREAFKVNLIPYNPTDSQLRGSGRDAIAAFRTALESRGVPRHGAPDARARDRRRLRPARGRGGAPPERRCRTARASERLAAPRACSDADSPAPAAIPV